LGPDQPFYGLQDGIHNPARIEDLAAHYLSEIQRVQPKGPYWLGGICSGGVVAFEMAQQLRAGGHEVALLALIEPAPPMGARLSAHINFFLLLLRRLWRRSAHHSRKVLELDTALQRDYLRLRVKLNANSWALRRYRPQPYAGLIHLFLTGTSLKLPGNPQLKWCDLSTQSVHVHEIPGNHDQVTGNNDTPIESAHIAVLAARLSTIIAQIDPPCP
jgi:thioesterase domain-containing protein